jgi:hypothetical protein
MNVYIDHQISRLLQTYKYQSSIYWELSSINIQERYILKVAYMLP